MNKKGVVLVIASVVMVVITVLTGVYMSGLVTEKRSVDNERYVLQALDLAEAGANQAVAELRKRLMTDLKAKVETIKQATTFSAYVSGNQPLELLRDYAYASGETQFSVSGGKATLTMTPSSFSTGVEGTFSATITIQSTASPTGSGDGPFVFHYSYIIESQGTVTKVTPNISKTVAFSANTFNLTLRRDNFAKFALFTSHHTTPAGTTVWFTNSTNFTGPVHTNDRFSFANNPSGHFTDEVTQKETRSRFYNAGDSKYADASAYPVDCTTDCTDKPTFDSTFERGVDIINLPSSITQTELRTQALGTMSNPGSTTAVYVPNDGSSCTGGIYISGNSGDSSDDSTIVMSSDGDKAVYTVTQYMGHPIHADYTTVVKVDYANNNTSVSLNGATPTVYSGKPDGVDNEGVLVYANDDIKGISGTVQKDSGVTISAEKDIIIDGSIKYEEYNASPLSATGYDNILGILAWEGDIIISTSAPDNINIHGVIMAPHGEFTVDDYNYGSPRGTATLLGGVITDFYGPFGTFSGGSTVTGYGRNFVYDARVLNGMAPPYFPYLTNFTSVISPSNTLYKKLIWREK